MRHMVRNKDGSTAAYINVREETSDLKFLYQMTIIRAFYWSPMRNASINADCGTSTLPN